MVEAKRIWQLRFELLTGAVHTRGIRIIELKVFAYLIDMFNVQAGCAWPKVETICHDLKLGERQVMRAVQRLCEFDLLETEKVAPGCYKYRPRLDDSTKLPKGDF